MMADPDRRAFPNTTCMFDGAEKAPGTKARYKFIAEFTLISYPVGVPPAKGSCKGRREPTTSLTLYNTSFEVVTRGFVCSLIQPVSQII